MEPEHIGQRRTAWAILSMLVFTVLYYAAFFRLDWDLTRLPTRPGELPTDFVAQFEMYPIIWQRSLSQWHCLPHWNPCIMGGAPFLAEPGCNLLSLQNLLCLLVRGPVAARLTIPVHLLVGWGGLYVLLRRLRCSRQAALAAGLVYVFNPIFSLFHGFTGHLNIVQGMAFVPWMLAVMAGQWRSQWTRYVLVGVLGALQLHAGAPTVFLYTAMFGLPVAAVCVVARSRRRLRDGAGLALAILVCLGLSWVRIAPARAFMAISGRRHGMSDAMAFFREYWLSLSPSGLQARMVDVAWTAYPWWMLLPLVVLAALGGLALWRRDRLGAGMTALCAGGALLLAYCRPLFCVLRRVVPMMGGQRCPQRAEFVFFLAVAVVVALGWDRFSRRLVATVGQRHARAAAAAGLVVLALLAVGTLFFRPAFPSMAPGLLSAREANPLLQATRADTAFHRVAAFEDRGEPDAWDHLTIPYGTRTLLGYPRLWHEDMMYSVYTDSIGVPQLPFAPSCLENPATMTGLLSVKYLLAQTPRDVAGLELVGRFDSQPLEPFPPEAWGPYLYRNTRAMPRAYTGPATVLLNGPDEWCRRNGLITLQQPFCEPRNVTLLYRPPDMAVENAAKLMKQADHIVSFSPDWTLPQFASKEIGAEQLRDLFDRPATEPVPQSVAERNPNHVELTVGAEAGRWLILSEKFAMFPGWRAEARTESVWAPLPMLRCNHVNTAVRLPAGAQAIRFRYTTPGFTAGLWLFAITASLAILLCIPQGRHGLEET